MLESTTRYSLEQNRLEATIERVRPFIEKMAWQLTQEELEKKGINRNYENAYDTMVGIAKIAKYELDKALE